MHSPRMPLQRPLDELRNARVTVMGLGRSGGGVAAVQFLLDRGAQVTVSDLRTADELAESLEALGSHPRLRLRLGAHDEADFRHADLIVVNPAVREDHPCLRLARLCGARLTTEIQLFCERCPGRIVGVTGSNGKSTTAAWTAQLLRCAGVGGRLGGNIGRSLLFELDSIRPQEWVVLELSSFQLALLDRCRFRPEVAVVTNLSPNHLDRHGTVSAYRRAKASLLRWQQAGDAAVLPPLPADPAHWPTLAHRYWFSRRWHNGPGVFVTEHEAVLRFDGIEQCVALPPSIGSTPSGRHEVVAAEESHPERACGRWPLRRMPTPLRRPTSAERENLAAALCAARLCGAELDALKEGVGRLSKLPDRLEPVAWVDNKLFVNDTQATTPESTLLALEAFARPMVLLAGGKDKGIDLEPLAEAIARRVRAVCLFGETGPRLKQSIERSTARSGRRPTIRLAAGLDEAFAEAVCLAQPGDVVLLSPGCSSYDQFTSCVERGQRFRYLVQRLSQSADNMRKSA